MPVMFSEQKMLGYFSFFLFFPLDRTLVCSDLLLVYKTWKYPALLEVLEIMFSMLSLSE